MSRGLGRQGSGPVSFAQRAPTLAWGAQTGAAGYAQATADQGAITAVVDLTGLTVTFAAIPGRRYRASVLVNVSQATALDGEYWVSIKEGAVVLEQMGTTNKTLNERYTTYFAYVTNASISGSKTWKVTCERNSGTSVMTAQGGASYPMYLLVEDIGPL